MRLIVSVEDCRENARTLAERQSKWKPTHLRVNICTDESVDRARNAETVSLC